MKNCKEICFDSRFNNNEGEARQIDISLVRTIFKQAYLAGREDGLNGIFIESNCAFENFTQNNNLFRTR